MKTILALLIAAGLSACGGHSAPTPAPDMARMCTPDGADWSMRQFDQYAHAYWVEGPGCYVFSSEILTAEDFAEMFVNRLYEVEVIR